VKCFWHGRKNHYDTRAAPNHQIRNWTGVVSKRDLFSAWGIAERTDRGKESKKSSIFLESVSRHHGWWSKDS
jgi:hypothetical protein